MDYGAHIKSLALVLVLFLVSVGQSNPLFATPACTVPVYWSSTGFLRALAFRSLNCGPTLKRLLNQGAV